MPPSWAMPRTTTRGDAAGPAAVARAARRRNGSSRRGDLMRGIVHRIHFPAMLDAPALPQIRFARAKKARRSQKAGEPPAAATVATPGRISPGLRLVLASIAVVLLFFGQRLQNPQPWSYDEYYHLGLAREMLSSGLRMETFRWTPFSITHDHFADGEPLFHVLLDRKSVV